MGLKVWLPLNGDLHNQGTSDLIFTAASTNTTMNTSGKIGACYTNNSHSAGGLISDKPILLGTQYSMCCWFKFTDLEASSNLGGGLISQHRYSKNTGFGLTIRYVSSTTGYLSVNTGTGSSRTYNTYYGTTLLQANTWYHACGTYDGINIKIYLNGVLEKTQAYTMSAPEDYLTIFCWSLSGNSGATIHSDYKLNGALNDVRIYDHALSAAEVREISQGLILHYKLNDAPILCKTNLTTWTKESGVTSTAQDDGSVKIDCTAKTSSRWGIYCDIQNILPNTPYTFSVDCKTAHVDKKWQLSVGCNPVPSGTSQFGSNRATMNSTSGFTTYTATVTTNADTTWIRFYLALSCSSTTPEYQYAFVKNVKMTIGTSLQTTIQDSSGYSHHGTVTGIIEAQTDTKRYNKSAYVNGSSYILTPASSFAWNDLTQLTFSAWMKPTASMTGWRGSVGIAADSNQTARGIAITDYGNEFRGTYTNGSGYQTVATGKTLTQNEWHHCAGTLNGTEFKLYFDGALVKTQTIDWGTATLNANARFEVGVDLPGTDEKFTGNYSDIRCYCTALDADTIRQLYEVGAKVDNRGNLHTFEINEFGANRLTKTGIMKDYMVEPYKTLSDGSHWQLMMYHYVDEGRNMFTSTNASYCNDFGLYSRLRDIDKFKYTDTLYEFYVIQDGLEYRWTQTNAPTTSSSPGTVTTISGYNNPSVGLAKNGSNTFLGYNSWWGACGCWTVWQGNAIPGFGGRNCTKYLALYARISNSKFKVATQNAYAENFIEL